MIRNIFFALYLVVVAIPLYAQDEPGKPIGYVALEELQLFHDMETSLEVQIGESMIGLVASNSEKESPEFARILRKLKQLNSFSFNLSATPRNNIDGYLEQLNSKLLNEQWEIVYRIREPENTANIYMKKADGEVAGMTIYSIDQNLQVVLINLVGNISLEDISELAERFGLPDITP
jgi:hypothetical protein